MKNDLKLFIVESPTKINTLKKLFNSLGKDKIIFKATLGHIKDLPVDKIGVSLETFEPNLYYLPSKRRFLNELKSLISKVKEVYLATDPDREGEAISYHLKEYLKSLNPSLSFYRLELHEITELGLRKALKKIRNLDENLYQSWKARRVCDRLIGYVISPFLSKNFKKPLSAGRVQSPALKLIVEREKEIENFVPQKTYSLEILGEDCKGKVYKIELFTKKQLLKKQNKEELLEIYEKYFENREIFLFSLKEKILKKYPPLPLKTSSLIDLAGKSFFFSPKETMKIAQKLYEEGYITYMRTDSVRVSPIAIKEAKTLIERVFGREYVGTKRRFKNSSFFQDAHECIRPTKVNLESVPLGQKERALYELIRKIFLASQMSEAQYLERIYEFKTEDLPKELRLILRGKRLFFDGFLALLGKEEKEEPFPNLKEGDRLKVKGAHLREHITQPPERYTSHSLIKKMESLGIGRPSTYATMLDILFTRGYIVEEGKYLKPTELGKRVCEFLEKEVSPLMDYTFTAKLESALDEIAQLKKDYYATVREVFELLERYLSR
ncbi:MAG: type I DNA topoisomerase [Caldimicrobium sp.]